MGPQGFALSGVEALRARAGGPGPSVALPMDSTARPSRRPRRREASSLVRRTLLVGLAGALVASCGSRSFGSDSPPAGPGVASRVTTDQTEPIVDLPGRISVLVRVFDENDVPVGDIPASRFNVFEDGQLVSQTESFQRILPRPEQFRSYQHLIIDRSNSVQSGGQDEIKAAARAYIAQVVGQDESFVKLSWFDGSDGLYEVEGHELGFTNSASALDAAVEALFDEPIFNPSTNLYGAVLRALDDLQDIDADAAADGIPNRALTLVTFTDGTHQVGNSTTLEQVTARLDSQAPSFNSFTIGVGQEIEPFVLGSIGKDGSVAVDDFAQLGGAFLNVVDQIRGVANSFYFLSYCSPKTAGEWDLTISLQPIATGAPNDVVLRFDSTGFGAGCAFLDVERHEDLSLGRLGGEAAQAIDAPDGKVLVAGWRSDGCGGPGCGQAAGAYVARYLASAHDADTVLDGDLDTTFGSGGLVRLDAGAQVAGATSIAVDDNTGTIYVGGWRRPVIGAGPSEAVIWVLGPDGSLASEIVMPNPMATDQAVESLVRTGTGELLAGGFRGTGSRSFAVWRVLSNLSLDGSFGDGAGVALHPATPEFGNEGATELVLAGDGRVYALGRAGGGIRAVALDRLTGAPMTSFGGTGAVDLQRTFGGIPRDARPGGAALDGQGRLVVSGSLVLPRVDGVLRDQPAVWRVLDTGAPDLDFVGSSSAPTYSTGVATLRSASTNDANVDFGRATTGRGLCIAPDGTILVTGERENLEGHTDMVVLAFDQAGRTSADYNLVGFVIEDGSAGNDSDETGQLVHVLPSGAIWTIGQAAADFPVMSPPTIATPTVWVDRDPARAFGALGSQNP